MQEDRDIVGNRVRILPPRNQTNLLRRLLARGQTLPSLVEDAKPQGGRRTRGCFGKRVAGRNLSKPRAGSDHCRSERLIPRLRGHGRSGLKDSHALRDRRCERF